MNRRPSVELEAGDIARLLQNFSNDARHTVEASADGLVSVRMGPTFTVLAIDFHDSRLESGLKRELENATLAAVNAAIRKVSLSAGQAFVDLQARKAAEPPKKDKPPHDR
jgi:DNA-binding protein YbaB